MSVVWQDLALCVKREYFIPLMFKKMMLYSLKHVKLIVKNHMFSLRRNLDHRVAKILTFSTIFTGVGSRSKYGIDIDQNLQVF